MTLGNLRKMIEEYKDYVANIDYPDREIINMLTLGDEIGNLLLNLEKRAQDLEPGDSTIPLILGIIYEDKELLGKANSYFEGARLLSSQKSKEILNETFRYLYCNFTFTGG